MEKKFKHNEIEKCSISKMEIDTTKDDYSIIVDCRGEEIKAIKFYKTELLLDLIKGNGEKVVKELQRRTGAVAQSMLERVGLMKKQVVIE